MNIIDPNVFNALVAAPENGLMERNVVTVFARSLDGLTLTQFPFWNDIDTVTIPLIDGKTNLEVNRNCVGDGAILDIDRIPQSTDYSIRTVRVVFSQIHPTVRNMLNGYDVRGARTEIHRLIFDPQVGSIVAAAQRPFIGRIDKAPQKIPGPGEEGNVPVDVVDAIRDMTRSSPAKKSDETQKRRSGDRGRRYVGTANVKVWWGQEKQNAAGTSSNNTTQTRSGVFGSSTPRTGSDR